MQILRLILILSFVQTSAWAGDASIDWSRGLLVAHGAAHGKRQSPSPSLARVDALLRAKNAARLELTKKLSQVPLAKSKKMGAFAAKHKVALAKEVDRAFVLDESYSSDGSVRVSMAIPLDAIRTLAFGESEGGKGKPHALILDARNKKIRPSVGVALAAGGESYRGPTRWFKSEKVMTEVGFDKAKRYSLIRFKDGSFVLEAGLSKHIALWSKANTLVLVLY